jgi:uncharacterized protein YbjT (DUF2867 family)
MILVVGATGLLGFEVCRQLRQEGHEVAALVRAPASPGASALAALGARIIPGDLTRVASLRSACTGIDTIVSTATATSRKGPEETIENVDRDGQLALVRAAVDAGVHRYVYVSAAPNRLNCPFLRYKREVEGAVRASGMSWVILQPTAFMDVWLSPMMGWDLKAGRARLIGNGDVRTSYVAVKDVAAFAVLAATRPGLVNRDLVLGGPEALSGTAVVAICERVTGRTFSVQRVPAAAVRTVSLLLRPFDTKMSSLLAMGANAALVGDSVDMRPLLDEFPVRLTPVEEHVAKVSGGVSGYAEPVTA